MADGEIGAKDGRNEARTASAGQLAAVFEQLPQSVVLHELVMDGNGMLVDYRILDMNPQCERETGLRRSAVKGQLASAIYGKGEAPWLADLAAVARGGPPVRHELRLPPHDRVFSFIAVPTGPDTFAAIGTDLTLAKAQAEVIEKNRLSLRALLDNQPHLAWLKDREGRFLAVNKAFAQACGQPGPEVVVGKTDLDVWPAALAEAYRDDDRAVMASGVQKMVEEQIADVEGTRWFETYKSPVFEPDGRIVGTTGIARDITERKNAEEARLRAERKLGRILDLAPDPIAVVNAKGECTFANQAFCELCGYERSELVGKRTSELDLWQGEGARLVTAAGASGGRGLRGAELVLRSRDGSLHHVELTVAEAEFEEASSRILAGRDVTRSRIAEATAKRAAESLARYFSLSIDLLCIATFEGSFVRLNPAWEASLGYPLSQLEGMRFLDLVHPEDREGTLDTVRRLRAGGQVVDFQNRYRHADGSWRWIEWRSAPSDEGLIYAVARDVTQRNRDEVALRAAERAAARSRERLLSVSQLAHIGHFTIDFATGAVSWTPELYRIVGRDPADLQLGLDTLKGVVAPADVPAVATAIAAARDSGQAQRFHFHVPRPNGELRYCLAIVEVEHDATLPADAVYGLVQDLTELRRAEEERRKLEQQVMQSQKLESLGVLAGGIAHDFNNLLTSILGNADLAQSELPPTNPARPYLDDIEQVSRRAADLCRQMLAYSGKGRFVVQPISLNEVVREMGHLLSVSISKNAVVKYNYFTSLPCVMADATQMRQVVMNLITNASEAIGKANGVVTLSTGVMDCDDDYLKGVVGDSEPHPAGQYVYLEVCDTGCGMDQETVARIFDPFFTTKFTGRGLGLAAVLGIVRGHKGALRVYSEKGRGTTFKVLLPAHRQLTPAPAVDRELEAPWHGHGVVLLADDEESIRSMGRRMFERAGFEVLVAADGKQAVALYAQHRARVRLVVLDMTMPHLDGEACYRELRRIQPSVKVIMTSGYNEQEVISRFVGKGLGGFVQKPYKAADLLPMVRRVLGE